MTAKETLRGAMLRERADLSLERRAEASRSFLEHVKTELNGRGVILSYAPFRGELDSAPTNLWLAAQGRLALPRVDGDSLRIFHVSDPGKQLSPGSWNIPEPVDCPELSMDRIEGILVPGLAFDQDKHRLGYGKGFFDRLLNSAGHIVTYGVGFREQLVEGKLPSEAHDVQLSELWLF